MIPCCFFDLPPSVLTVVHIHFSVLCLVIAGVKTHVCSSWAWSQGSGGHWLCFAGSVTGYSVKCGHLSTFPTYTVHGTSSSAWLPTWVVFASPTLTLRLRPRSGDPSSCFGPTRNGPSLACPTFPCSASTKSLLSRWLKVTWICCSAGRASTLLISTNPNKTPHCVC